LKCVWVQARLKSELRRQRKGRRKRRLRHLVLMLKKPKRKKLHRRQSLSAKILTWHLLVALSDKADAVEQGVNRF
jgi:hypothetical protein